MRCKEHQTRECQACRRAAPEATLAEIAAELGVSTQRVQQLEAKALEKVRRGFRRAGITSVEDAIADLPRPRYRATGAGTR